MAYDYVRHRNAVFTEDGLRMVLAVLFEAQDCLKRAGAVRADVLLNAATGAVGACDVWDAMACVEWLVELEYLRLIPQDTAWQNGVYVAGRKSFP